MRRLFLNDGRFLPVALLLAAAPAAAQFTDLSVPPLDEPLASDGVSWGDCDRDGDYDLFVGNKTWNRLFRNDAGSYVDVATPVMADTTTHTRGVPWGDYDNDGDLDLYLCNQKSNRLFRNDGSAFADVTVPPLDDAVSTRTASWVDFDLDGDLDLYLANEGPNRLLRNDAGTFVNVATGPLADAGITSSCVWGDVDNDGDPDLYLANGGTGNRLIRNDGGGAFTDITSGPLGNTGAGRGADLGDFDNDGDLDLYFTNNTSANKLLRNDGGGVWVNATSGPLGDASSSTGVAWADFDNDGDLDLYIANWTSPNRLFRNDGGGSFVDATAAPLDNAGPGKGVAWCDYDGDGDVDLYLANSGIANGMFRNDTSGNHWLHVDLAGTVSNRAAIGARVRVKTAAGSQIREVSGGFGVGSQGSLTLEFGLAAATVVDSVIVSWPSGTVQALTAVAADQRMLITEASANSVPGTPRPSAAPLIVATDPNPFSRATTIRWEMPHAGSADLCIYDVLGRPVRRLASGEVGAGPHEAVWDGQDAHGRTSPVGVYFCRLSAAGVSETRRVVLLR